MTRQGAQARTGPTSLAATLYGIRGPWLVLIHGWCCDRAVWADLAPVLAQWARVVTLDLPGHSVSAAPVADVSILGMARTVAASLRALCVESPILIGHSLGGAVALEAAILLDRDCQGVIGVDTFTDMAFYTRRPSEEIAARRAGFAADFAGTMAAMVRRITLSGAPHVVEHIARSMARADPSMALTVLDALLDWDIAARWPSVPCPVETINSAQLAHGIERVPGLQALRVHLMEGVGHLPMCEDPAGLADLIGEIVRRHA